MIEEEKKERESERRRGGRESGSPLTSNIILARLDLMVNHLLLAKGK